MLPSMERNDEELVRKSPVITSDAKKPVGKSEMNEMDDEDEVDLELKYFGSDTSDEEIVDEQPKELPRRRRARKVEGSTKSNDSMEKLVVRNDSKNEIIEIVDSEDESDSVEEFESTSSDTSHEKIVDEKPREPARRRSARKSVAKYESIEIDDNDDEDSDWEGYPKKEKASRKKNVFKTIHLNPLRREFKNQVLECLSYDSSDEEIIDEKPKKPTRCTSEPDWEKYSEKEEDILDDIDKASVKTYFPTFFRLNPLSEDFEDQVLKFFSSSDEEKMDKDTKESPKRRNAKKVEESVELNNSEEKLDVVRD